MAVRLLLLRYKRKQPRIKNVQTAHPLRVGCLLTRMIVIQRRRRVLPCHSGRTAAISTVIQRRTAAISTVIQRRAATISTVIQRRTAAISTVIQRRGNAAPLNPYYAVRFVILPRHFLSFCPAVLSFYPATSCHSAPPLPVILSAAKESHERSPHNQ